MTNANKNHYPSNFWLCLDLEEYIWTKPFSHFYYKLYSWEIEIIWKELNTIKLEWSEIICIAPSVMELLDIIPIQIKRDLKIEYQWKGNHQFDWNKVSISLPKISFDIVDSLPNALMNLNLYILRMNVFPWKYIV